MLEIQKLGSMKKKILVFNVQKKLFNIDFHVMFLV